MKHPASRQVYNHWNERRGERTAPERGEIEPGAIRGALGDVFILGLDGTAGHPIRLAGTRVCALFGREIKGDAFLALWIAASQPLVAGLLAVLAEEQVGTVAAVTAQESGGQSLDLEILLLPLVNPRPALARAIGVLAPLKVPPWLGASPLGALSLGARRHVGAEIEARLRPRFLSPRRHRGLLVYEGGRS